MWTVAKRRSNDDDGNYASDNNYANDNYENDDNYTNDDLYANDVVYAEDMHRVRQGVQKLRLKKPKGANENDAAEVNAESVSVGATGQSIRFPVTFE